MNSSDEHKFVQAPTNFAEGDTAEGGDLKRRIAARFMDRFPNLKGIQITVFGKTADLRGEVRSLAERYQCVECCRHVPGVVRVVDDLTAVEQAPLYFDPEED